jgi:5'-nucleotidase
MRVRTILISVAAVVLVGAALTPVAGAASSQRSVTAAETTGPPLRILVTNDDGVAAPGLATLVDALQAVPNVEVTVVAPATNQSGVGDRITTTAITAAPATTANGDAATSVSGTPADSVLYAIQVALPQPPHLIVSGTNLGQNLGDITTVSGTVGAGRTGNRLGIPALALSAGFGTNIATAYQTAASVAAGWVNMFRSFYLDESNVARTLNINVPTCGVGSVRGFLAVPLGRSQSITGYTPTSGVPGNGTFLPTVVTRGVLNQNIDCSSGGTGFDNDIDAFNAGFIPMSVVNPDLAEI